MRKAFQFNRANLDVGMRDWLKGNGLWPEGATKPPDPKGAVETTLRVTRIPRSSAIYKQITSRVSIKNCVDPAFLKLQATLQEWFPV